MARIQRRLTSNNIEIKMLPCGEASTHEMLLTPDSNFGTQDFKLKVNGKLTDSFSAPGSPGVAHQIQFAVGNNIGTARIRITNPAGTQLTSPNFNLNNRASIASDATTIRNIINNLANTPNTGTVEHDTTANTITYTFGGVGFYGVTLLIQSGLSDWSTNAAFRSGTDATSAGARSDLITSLNTNLPTGLSAAAKSGSTTAITIESSEEKWYTIEKEHDDDPITLQLVEQGAGEIDLTADAMTFDFTIDVKDTEGAAMNEFEDYPFPISSGANFTISMYRVKSAEWELPMAIEGLTALMTIYPTGNYSGNEVFAFNAEMNSLGDNFPFRDKIEVKLSGKRQGKMVIPRGTKVN